MSDQQRCPECRDKAWNGWCGVCNPLPGQEPLVVPDSVIEEAAATAIDPLAEQRIIPSREDLQLAVELAAPPIATWAREQGRTEERARIKTLVEARIREAGEDYQRDPDAYHRGREDELLVLLDELDEDLTAAGKEQEQ